MKKEVQTLVENLLADPDLTSSTPMFSVYVLIPPDDANLDELVQAFGEDADEHYDADEYGGTDDRIQYVWLDRSQGEVDRLRQGAEVFGFEVSVEEQ